MLKAERISKSYVGPAGTLPILSDITLELNRGDAIAVMGPSGSGKSTLLHVLGALDSPSEGSVSLDGKDYARMRDTEQSAFRGEHIGFVFQDHALLPQCTVLENVLVPTLIAPQDTYETRARTLLQKVGLEPRLNHKPAQLSGGEKQRVAIARALIRKPDVILCDEPTGNLDQSSAENIGSLLLELARESKAILVAVTHSAQLAAKFPLRYELIKRGLRPV